MRLKSDHAPTLDFSKALINSVNPLYKTTYKSCDCPRKFNKVWDLWVNSDTTTGSYVTPSAS